MKKIFLSITLSFSALFIITSPSFATGVITDPSPVQQPDTFTITCSPIGTGGGNVAYIYDHTGLGDTGAFTVRFCPDTSPISSITSEVGSEDFDHGIGHIVLIDYSSPDFEAADTACHISYSDCLATDAFISDSPFTLLAEGESLPTPTPTPGPAIKISASPASGIRTVGVPFNVSVVVSDYTDLFNAAQATVALSSNLSITGIHNPTSGACHLQYTQTPTTSNPSFAGAIYGGSSLGCTIYSLTLLPTDSGTGTITFTNSSLKRYSDGSEILTGVNNATFAISSSSATPTPTPTFIDFTVTSPYLTYKESFNIIGTKIADLTHIFVNESDEDSTYPTSTTWSTPTTLTLGENAFSIYGTDDEDNPTPAVNISVNRHTLADINGDGYINLVDASLFAVDWGKDEDLTYILSDMNDDGSIDLTDLSILARLED